MRGNSNTLSCPNHPTAMILSPQPHHKPHHMISSQPPVLAASHLIINNINLFAVALLTLNKQDCHIAKSHFSVVSAKRPSLSYLSGLISTLTTSLLSGLNL